jgi:hypothetical protein
MKVQALDLQFVEALLSIMEAIFGLNQNLEKDQHFILQYLFSKIKLNGCYPKFGALHNW